ncbi:MAG: hypothetical protein GY870_21085 [archaeon]|nr:hypothetical protein [archaeon]
MEIKLEELDSWYTEQLDEYYFKYKRNLSKLLEKIEKSMVNLKVAVNKMIERKDQVELDEKSEKYLDRFYNKVKGDISEINVPEKPTYSNVSKFLDEIKKLFQNIHEAGRKNIPRFAEQFKIELKEIDMITRKISDNLFAIDKFLRKKYGDVKEAESLSKKFGKLENLVERIQNTKATLDNLKGQRDSEQNILAKMEEELIEIESNPLYAEKSKLDKELVKLRMEFDSKLKFKKALKKLKKKIEKSGSFKGITPDQLRKYLSNPITTIVNDGEKHPQLTEFLVQLRYLLENESSVLQLKADTRNKTLANIEQIVSKNILKDLILHYNRNNQRIEELNKELDKEQLSSRLEKLKEKISDKTQATEHMIGDLNHKSNEYRGLLEKLKEEREDICSKIKNYVEIDDIKIQITLNY